ncbi:hypothetical protein [Frankia sp. Cj5]|nr:hypothetical protein [Frankia sp. Cj5]
MTDVIEKPAHVFDRDFEWGHLVRFAARVGGPAQLGVVTGRPPTSPTT